MLKDLATEVPADPQPRLIVSDLVELTFCAFHDVGGQEWVPTA